MRYIFLSFILRERVCAGRSLSIVLNIRSAGLRHVNRVIFDKFGDWVVVSLAGFPIDQGMILLISRILVLTP